MNHDGKDHDWGPVGGLIATLLALVLLLII